MGVDECAFVAHLHELGVLPAGNEITLLRGVPTGREKSRLLRRLM